MRAFSLFISIILLTSLSFAKDITRSRTVQDFFKEKTTLRVSKEAVEVYKTALNQTSLQVIQRATELAQEENRKTVLKKDIVQATDEIFRRAPIEVSELMEKVTQLSIIELSDLSNKVKAYGDEVLKQKE